eukprot:scaffold268197_cov46-Prasinocladus_malaysianus.AAC.2
MIIFMPVAAFPISHYLCSVIGLRYDFDLTAGIILSTPADAKGETTDLCAGPEFVGRLVHGDLLPRALLQGPRGPAASWELVNGRDL